MWSGKSLGFTLWQRRPLGTILSTLVVRARIFTQFSQESIKIALKFFDTQILQEIEISYIPNGAEEDDYAQGFLGFELQVVKISEASIISICIVCTICARYRFEEP